MIFRSSSGICAKLAALGAGPRAVLSSSVPAALSVPHHQHSLHHDHDSTLLPLLVLQPVFKHFKLQGRRPPSLQLEEAVGLAEATDLYHVVGSHQIKVNNMSEMSFFSSGKLSELTELVNAYANPHANPHHGSPAIGMSPPIAGVFVNTLNLSPRQQYYLEDEWQVPVYDRFKVILDIFEARAHTREAKIQVALAKIPYERERLVSSTRLQNKIRKERAKRLLRSQNHARHGTHQHPEDEASPETVYFVGRDSDKDRLLGGANARNYAATISAFQPSVMDSFHDVHALLGGGGDSATGHDPAALSAHAARKGLRDHSAQVKFETIKEAHDRQQGSGASWLEKEKKKLSVLERKLKEELKRLDTRRETLKSHHAKDMHRLPVVAVIGYTNAGKTALVRRLTGSEDIVPQDMLFATLDTAARLGKLPSGMQAIFVDTVGFVSDLPHQLVDAFKSTLSETKHADLLVHLTDRTDPDMLDQQSCVLDVLHDLGVPQEKTSNRVQVFSKIDLVPHEEGSTQAAPVSDPLMPRTNTKSGSSTKTKKNRKEVNSNNKQHSGSHDSSSHDDSEGGGSADWKNVNRTMRKAHINEIDNAHAINISVVTDENIDALQAQVAEKLGKIFDRHQYDIIMPATFTFGVDELFKHGIVHDVQLSDEPPLPNLHELQQANEYVCYTTTAPHSAVNRIKSHAAKELIPILVTLRK